MQSTLKISDSRCLKLGTINFWILLTFLLSVPQSSICEIRTTPSVTDMELLCNNLRIRRRNNFIHDVYDQQDEAVVQWVIRFSCTNIFIWLNRELLEKHPNSYR